MRTGRGRKEGKEGTFHRGLLTTFIIQQDHSEGAIRMHWLPRHGHLYSIREGF
ncbi:hypothetical protein E2C01_100071 [Portunus trituberculatus]|uniref:Uncharacterized protein n=1 Tax=Portunus trituberculatus TaxID=210409 RepID=A0A5B7KC10_PORTR|nr:hypothetical protein [Portunus trituberculatus]